MEFSLYLAVLVPPVVNAIAHPPAWVVAGSVEQIWKDGPVFAFVSVRLLIVRVCAWTGADGNRTTPARRERTPNKAHRLRRPRLGAGGTAPQQASSESRASAEPMRLPLRQAGGGSLDVPENSRQQSPDTGYRIPDTGYRTTLQVFLCQLSRRSLFRQVVPGQQGVTVRGAVTVRTWGRPMAGFHADGDNNSTVALGHCKASDNLPPPMDPFPSDSPKDSPLSHPTAGLAAGRASNTRSSLLSMALMSALRSPLSCFSSVLTSLISALTSLISALTSSIRWFRLASLA